MAYYDGTKLLSLMDINGNKPEIYLCTTNRSGGKTTYFSRLLVNKFLQKQGKFLLIYRYKYEIYDAVDKFFKDAGGLFFPEKVMTGKLKARGLFMELFLDEVSCGYAVALNSAENIKTYSHFFSDVNRMFFDEFQSETNHYCDDEIKKFQSVHTSVARGKGEMTRYVPVYMCGNPVSIINPYYVKLGISNRLRDNTKFLRGDGFVLEQGFVKDAADAFNESSFNRAFAGDKYNMYASQGVYLNDSKSFIGSVTGRGRYLATIKYKDRDFAIREYGDDGIIYCDDRPDKTSPNKITVSTADHEINYVMLKRNDVFLKNLRYFFERGCFRFKDLSCKEAVLQALSY